MFSLKAIQRLEHNSHDCLIILTEHQGSKLGKGWGIEGIIMRNVDRKTDRDNVVTVVIQEKKA